MIEPPDGFAPPFARAFKYPARVAIVGVLADARGDSLGASEVAAQAGIAPSTFHDHREALVELALVERRDHGSRPTYALAETDVAERLVEFDEALERALVDARTEYEEPIESFIE